MDYQTYNIALSPDLGITPEEFANAWNETDVARTIAEAQLSEAKGLQFLDPMIVTVLISVSTGVASNLWADYGDEQIDPGIRMGDKPCHAERSEASLCPARQTLRCAQGDSVGADLSRPPPIYRPVMLDDAHVRIEYSTSIIAPTADSAAFDGCPNSQMKKHTGATISREACACH